jgi:hypothetical protein
MRQHVFGVSMLGRGAAPASHVTQRITGAFVTSQALSGPDDEV